MQNIVSKQPLRPPTVGDLDKKTLYSDSPFEGRAVLPASDGLTAICQETFCIAVFVSSSPSGRCAQLWANSQPQCHGEKGPQNETPATQISENNTLKSSVFREYCIYNIIYIYMNTYIYIYMYIYIYIYGIIYACPNLCVLNNIHKNVPNQIKMRKYTHTHMHVEINHLVISVFQSVWIKHKLHLGSYGRFRRWRYPQIIHLNEIFPYKPSIWGYSL